MTESRCCVKSLKDYDARIDAAAVIAGNLPEFRQDIFVANNLDEAGTKVDFFLNMAGDYSHPEYGEYNNGKTFIGRYGVMTPNAELVSSLNPMRTGMMEFLTSAFCSLVCKNPSILITDNKKIVDGLYTFVPPARDIMKIAPGSIKKIRKLLLPCKLKKYKTGAGRKYGFEEIEGLRPAIEQLRKNRKDAAGWVDILSCQNELVRAEAVKVLTAIGKPAVILLTKALSDDEDDVRRAAVEALNGINVGILDFVKKNKIKTRNRLGYIEGGGKCSRTNYHMSL